MIDKLKSNFDILIDFIDLHSLANSSSDKIIQLNVLSSDGVTSYKKNIIINPTLEKEAQYLEKVVGSSLSSNNEVNKITLLNLLEKLVNKK